MKAITLDKLRTLAAAVANAEQGSKAWDAATDALNAKFSPRCLVVLIDLLEFSQREAERFAVLAGKNAARAGIAEAEIKRRDEQDPVGEVIEMSGGPVMDGLVHLNSNTYREINGARNMKRMPVGTKFYAAPAAVLPPEVTGETISDIAGLEWVRDLDQEECQCCAEVYNQALADAKALGCQPAPVVKLPAQVDSESVAYGGSGAFTMGKQCGINEGIVRCAAALDAAGVKWVEGE